jgi:PKD repeat protein
VAKFIIHALQASLLILSCANVSRAQVPQVPHVLIVLEENTDYADVCGPNNTSMPFLCGLKSKGSFSANYYAPTHPSIGNYEDLGWGVVTTNDDNCNPNTCGFPYAGNNIVRAAQAGGKSWKGYAESLPANCYFGGDSGNYAVHHSPIPYISEVQSNCQNRYVAFEDSNLGFIHDVASNTIPNFSFITPNMCDDAHDCGLDVADNWLKNNVLQPLLNSGHLDSATGDTVVIVVFDESGGDNTHGGGKVFFFMIGKNVKQNYQSAGPSVAPNYYSHGSSLRVIAEMLGLSLSGLGGAATAPDMAEFFGNTTNSLPPVAALTVTPQGGTAPVQVTADSSGSSDSNGGITSRLIDFGDGTTSTNVTATHTYNSAGTFTLTLSVTDNLHLTSTASDTVTVQSAPQPISVSVSPTSATVSSGGTRQFAATVANTANQGIIWTATAGAISSSGLFTAPAVSTSTAITVTAASAAAPSKAARATVTVQPPAPQPISVSVSPTSTTVRSGGTLQFAATVANTINQAVTWTTTAGAISGTGLLAAPGVSTSTTIMVTATSVAAPSKWASATVTVQPSRHHRISIAVSPTAATVSSGSTQQFTTTVANTTNQAVTWTATAGTISGGGLFTAPVVLTNTTVTVTASSVVARSAVASATITVLPSAPQPISVAVSPTLAALSSGATRQFTATVANTTNEAVTWTATAGSISPSGLFTAPTVSTTTMITVRASSVAAPSKTASANVTVAASSPSVAPSAQTVQHNSGFIGSASSLAVTFKSSVTAGHILLVAQSTFDGETLIAPADSQNNVFAQLVTGRSPGDSVAAIYIATAKTTGPDTVTCKIGAGASDNIHCHIYEVSGTTAVVDAVGSAMQTGESLSMSTSKATANANDYVFAYFSDDVAESTYAAGPGFGDTEQSVSSSLDSAFSEDKSVTATGIQTATATGSIADPFVELIVALKNSQTTVVTPTPPSCTLSVSPASGPAPLNVNASATCTDPQNDLVSTVITWGDGSSINAASGSHTYPNAGSFAIKVTATGSSNLTGSATQTVVASSLIPPPSISVTVTPASAIVSSNGTQLFAAIVTNTANQAVTWRATAGTISAGLFRAPVVSTKSTVVVTANSVAAPSQSASVTVQVLPTAPSPSSLTPSGPINLAGQNGTVVENLHITNPSGDCLVISNSTNITIRRSEIGPCGGHGVKISGGSTTGIYDSYIHPEKPLATDCCDTHDGIFANKTSNLTIQGNVIAYGESNIEISNSTTVTAIGNFLLNPIDSDPSQPADGQSRGQNFQAWGGNSGVNVENNYALSSTDRSKYLFPENQEDSINFGLTNGILVQGNYITGGHSPSGCGVIADDASNSAQFLNNRLLDTGQCGLSIASGTNQVVKDNRILNRTPVTGGGNTAIMVWNQYSSACGPVAVSGNIATESKPDGSQSGFWNGGGCGTLSSANNTFDDAALSLLTPSSTTMPPPSIPPAPKDCVVVSPFTNNTSLPPCSTK